MSAPRESDLEVAKQSLVEGDPPHRVRVILSRGVDFRCEASELPFDLHRCEDTTLLPDLGEGVCSNVLFVDLALRPMSETAQLRARIEQLNNAFTIALSDEKDNLNSEQIIRLGFAGILRRDESLTTVVRAVQAVVNGQLWFPRKMLSQVLRMLLAKEGQSRLTSREVEILKLIGAGLNNQEIADTLYISRETVRWHVKSLYSKLGIKDRRSAREYCRSIQRGKAKSVRSEAGNTSKHSGTAG